MASYARLRADIDIREAATFASHVIERFPSNSPVEILDDQGEWLHIKPIRIDKAVSGYIPRLGLVFPDIEPPSPVFPVLSLDEGARSLPSVPTDLPLRDFLTWLDTSEPPPWIPVGDWNQLEKEAKDNVISDVKAATVEKIPTWQVWINDVISNERLDETKIDEWLVIVAGGWEIFTARDHYIYQMPALNSPTLGTALKGQVLHWTGQVHKSETDGVMKTFYQVDFFRLSREMHGWFRSDLTAFYNFPTPENDPELDRNKTNVFDLSKPILRIPEDQEFATAKATGYTGAQYINIRNALGKSLVHYSLCGEICVSALVGSDVIPLLKTWLESGYWRVPSILNNPKEGTGAADLRSILQIFGLSSEMYNSTPVPPQFIKDRLARGEFAISGCGITATGKVRADGKIRHWVILEDVLPVGNSGWVRVYNPFQNQEEVYEYNMFMTSAGTGTGLWIKP